jgi:archaellum component FlaC
LDENKLINLENENKMIKVGHEKLKNDINRLIQEMKKLKEENEVYKTDHDSLTKENSILKNESDNYKKQMIIFQEENTALKKQLEEVNNQFASYNKDMDAVENQNNEIRKMYEDLENEYNQYKSQTEDINKQNELLRAQIEELNNNFTMINKELENIRNENDIFKSNLEQQSKNLNGDMINKLIEENNILKEKVEENEYLKRQIEELRYQKRQESQEKEDEDHEQVQERENEQEQENQGGEEEEEKGEIIHDMKELELITDKINKENKKIIINLLYKASVDGDKASIFHQKCDQAKSTIVLVETLNGKRFGGFTTCSWAGNCEDKNDPQSFIFSLDKMETYENIPGDEAIGCYPKFGPIFLGCQIKIFDDAFTKGGTTFEKELNFNTKEDYELTGGDRVFQIKEIEVYEVVIE